MGTLGPKYLIYGYLDPLGMSKAGYLGSKHRVIGRSSRGPGDLPVLSSVRTWGFRGRKDPKPLGGSKK